MKAVQIIARGKAIFVDRPEPHPGPGEAVIRPVCLSLCASDIFLLHYAEDDAYPLPVGTSGHEVVGRVEALNGSHPEVARGDLVLAISPPQVAMAELFVASLENVLPVPPGVKPEELVQAQQLGTVIYACRQLPNLIGQSVVIIGQGSAGLWFNVMTRRLGARHVIALDRLPHRLALSRQYGATAVVNNAVEDPVARVQELLDGRLADVVIEAAGESAAINLAIDLARDYGFILQFGVPHESCFRYNFGRLFLKNLHAKACVAASREPDHVSTRQALELIASGEVDVHPVITHRFPFDRVLEAYELQRSRRDGAVKIIIDMLAD